MVTKSIRKTTRTKNNITQTIFITIVPFCILLSLCRFEAIYFLLSDYTEEQKDHSTHSEDLYVTEHTTQQSSLNSGDSQRSIEQQDTSISDGSPIPPFESSYTELMQLLQNTQENNETNQTASTTYHNETDKFITELQTETNMALEKNHTNSISNEETTVATFMKERVLPIGITILVISILSSFLLAKLIATPFLSMSQALKNIINLDFSNYQSTSRNTLSDDIAQAQRVVQQLHETNTELKKELDQSQKEFFSVVSHELKTPITAVMGQLDGMIYGIGAYKDRDKYLKRSYEMMQGMNTTIEELSELSRLQNPQFKLKLDMISLSPMIEDIMRKMDYFIGIKQLKVHSHIEQNIHISANYPFLETAITNIISNAIHYTIDHQHIYIKLYERPTGYALEVLNTGAQIEEDKLTRIFEPFYRANPSQHGAVQGSGLGLYIVKQILDKHQFSYGIQNTSRGVKCEVIFPKTI